MANKEHLARLKQGVEAWNQWRRENPDARPDLSQANLGGAHLVEADLSGTNLFWADLAHANLHNADFSRSNLFGANLCGANLHKAILHDADLCDTGLDCLPGPPARVVASAALVGAQ
jgi:Pentapeptide repeats (8 copies)